MNNNIFDIIYESFSIYRSIVICKDESQVRDICDILKNKDHAITTTFQDVSSTTRIIVVSKAVFDYDHDKFDIQWKDYNVLFVDAMFRDQIQGFTTRYRVSRPDFSVLIDHVQIIAFFDDVGDLS